MILNNPQISMSQIHITLNKILYISFSMQLTNIIFIADVREVKIKDNAHRSANIELSAGSRHLVINTDW